MNKKEFCIYLRLLEEQMNLDSENSKHLNKVFNNLSAYDLLYNNQKLIDGYIELLKMFIDDDDDFIDYFIYECNFGSKEGWVTFKEIKYSLKTPEDLYDFLSIYNINNSKT